MGHVLTANCEFSCHPGVSNIILEHAMYLDYKLAGGNPVKQIFKPAISKTEACLQSLWSIVDSLSSTPTDGVYYGNSTTLTVKYLTFPDKVQVEFTWEYPTKLKKEEYNKWQERVNYELKNIKDHVQEWLKTA